MPIVPSKVFVGLEYQQHSTQVCILDEHGSQLVNAIPSRLSASWCPKVSSFHAANES
ncbi:MAG: hypothetical protein AAF709_26145 [Pseudomonadota bacterium]